MNNICVCPIAFDRYMKQKEGYMMKYDIKTFIISFIKLEKTLNRALWVAFTIEEKRLPVFVYKCFPLVCCGYPRVTPTVHFMYTLCTVGHFEPSHPLHNVKKSQSKE